MKTFKTIVTIITLFVLFSYKTSNAFAVCWFSMPTQIAQGRNLDVTVNNLKDFTTYDFYLLARPGVGVAVGGALMSSKVPDGQTSWTVPITNVTTSGTYAFKVVEQATGSIFCDMSTDVTVIQPQTVAPGGGVPNPIGWLPFVNPGFGPDPLRGIYFFTDNLKTFLISLFLFLIIVLSLIFTMIGAVMFMTSGGNKEGMAKAKNTITYALIGLVLGLGSFIIINVIGKFFGSNLINP